MTSAHTVDGRRRGVRVSGDAHSRSTPVHIVDGHQRILVVGVDAGCGRTPAHTSGRRRREVRADAIASPGHTRLSQDTVAATAHRGTTRIRGSRDPDAHSGP